MKFSRRIGIALIVVASVMGVVSCGATPEEIKAAIQKVTKIYRDNFLDKETNSQIFHDTTSKIKAAYDERMARQDASKLSDREKDELFFKIASSEVSKFREYVDNQPNEPIFRSKGDELRKFVGVLFPWEILKARDPWNPKKFVDIEAAKRTIKQLEVADKEAQIAKEECEADSPRTGEDCSHSEALKKIQTRTRNLAQEVLSQELRQMALALMENYMQSKTDSGQILVKFGATIRYKVLNFFIGDMVDILSSVLGKKIDIGEVIPPPRT